MQFTIQGRSCQADKKLSAAAEGGRGLITIRPVFVAGWLAAADFVHAARRKGRHRRARFFGALWQGAGSGICGEGAWRAMFQMDLGTCAGRKLFNRNIYMI